jgi:hypothetical protein
MVEEQSDEWFKAIEEAKRLMNVRQNIQMEIAKLACKVCEITSGGSNKSETHHTLKNFADESGIKYKTLSNWVAVYKGVYSRVPVPVREKASYATLSTVAQKVRADTPQAKVIETLKTEMNRSGIEPAISRYCQDLRSLLFNLHKTEIFECDAKILEETFYYVRKLEERFRDLAKEMKLKPAQKSFKLDLQYAASEVGRIKINKCDKQIYAFLRKSGKKDFTPTELGKVFTRKSKTASKVAALRSLQKLETFDLVKKGKNGRYFLSGRSA